jgi:hypothetical protein
MTDEPIDTLVGKGPIGLSSKTFELLQGCHEFARVGPLRDFSVGNRAILGDPISGAR